MTIFICVLYFNIKQYKYRRYIISLEYCLKEETKIGIQQEKEYENHKKVYENHIVKINSLFEKI